MLLDQECLPHLPTQAHCLPSFRAPRSYTGQRTTLSEQEIVSCDEYDYGCDGELPPFVVLSDDFANAMDAARARRRRRSNRCASLVSQLILNGFPIHVHPSTGGDFRNVYRWVIRNGISADADWPYEAEVTACHHKRIKR